MPDSDKQAPFDFIRRWHDRLTGAEAPVSVLDLACGGGRHGRLFLDRAETVTFIDRNVTGVADLKGQARVIEADLENGADLPFAPASFSLVIVTNYLWRPILPAVFGAVAPGGYILYETFADGNAAYGRPGNPDFLLTPNELLGHALPDFTVLEYAHGYEDQPKPAVKQRMAAQRGG